MSESTKTPLEIALQETMETLTLQEARRTLQNLIHYRNGCSHYETDLTTLMLALRGAYLQGREAQQRIVAEALGSVKTIETEVVALRGDDSQEVFRVFVISNGVRRITTPQFEMKGPAEAYADLIRNGIRKPEYGNLDEVV